MNTRQKIEHFTNVLQAISDLEWCERVCGAAVCVCECKRVILDFFLCLLILYYLLDVKYVHTMRHGNGTCKTVQIFLLITSVKSTNMIPKIEFKSK